MCSKCHNRKVCFSDYIKDSSRIKQDTGDELFICSQCKRIYKFGYPIGKKKIAVISNTISTMVLIIAYIFGRKYIRFLELILEQFDIELNVIFAFLVGITEFVLGILAINIIYLAILVFIEWKLARPTEVKCQDEV